MIMKKTFDCVAMKNDIQKRLYEERKGMTPQEVKAAIEEKLDTSQAPIAQWWRKINKGNRIAGSSAGITQ